MKCVARVGGRTMGSDRFSCFTSHRPARLLMQRVRGSLGRRCGQRGQALVLAAIGMASLLGMTGVVIDAGLAYVQYRQAQSAADAAAIAAADDLPGPNAPLVPYQVALAQSDAQNVAATTNAPSNGFLDGVANTSVAIQAPYNAGLAACVSAPNSCARVAISRQISTTFLRVLGVDHISVSRSGVAMITTVAGLPCTICVLDASMSGALNDTGGGTLTLQNGALVVNSTSSSAVTLGSNAMINVSGGTIGLVGNWNNKGTMSPAPALHAPPAPDPLAAVPYPNLAYASCPNVTAAGQTATTITPGCYHDLSITGNGSLILQSGLYIITGNVKNTGTGSGGIQGTGVSLFFHLR
jgi:hypothetical protein